MSSPTINKAIYTISSFYKSNETKSRAKELINELSSDERKMILSLLNKDNNPSTGIQGLAVKLLSVTAMTDADTFAPISHEKDAERSSFGKTMMNVWRAIKDFFGTRISDSKLLKEINKFSKNAVLEKMDELDEQFNTELLKPAPVDFNQIVQHLQQSENYTLDLTTIEAASFEVISDHDFSYMKKIYIQSAIQLMAEEKNKNLKNLQEMYNHLLLADMIKKEFFSDNSIISAETLITKVQARGFDNLSLPQKNLVRMFSQAHPYLCI